MKRIWILLLLVGFLGGCQQPGGTELRSTSAARAKSEELHYFEPEFSALLDQVTTKLERVCAMDARHEDRLNGCIRDQFAAAFDDSGQGRRSCDFHIGVADFIGCVAVGNTFIDIRHRLDDDSPVPAQFWREEGAMINALVQTIVKHGIDACGVSSDSRQVRGCVEDWFEKQVALPSGLTGRCDQQTTDKDRYGCIVEAVMLRYLQDHVPRLGAVNT
jgi:hypothetical protein